MSIVFVILLVFFFAGGIAYSWVAWREDVITQWKWFHLSGLAFFLVMLLLLVFAGGRPIGAESLVVALSLGAMAISWGPFVAHMIAYTLFKTARRAVSLDDIHVPPSYSYAEAALARGQVQQALALYRKVAAEYPQESEPFRRVAEILLKHNRLNEAVDAFREAEMREKDVEGKLMLNFAIAELQERQGGRPDQAVRTIEGFLAQYPNVRGRNYAEQRLRALREKLKEGRTGA